jgi:Ran GTPase-activating protein (RanGAP) involved in mRNA processing and transport
MVTPILQLLCSVSLTPFFCWLVSCNDINSTGAAALSKFLSESSTLQTLNLSRNHLGPQGTVSLVQGLSSCRTLECLDISRNHTGEGGAAALSAILREETCSLVLLDLRWNGIRAAGASLLAQSLKTNMSLKYLGLFSVYLFLFEFSIKQISLLLYFPLYVS